MAKIKQGILGGFSGSVAGVVGSSWKGRAVMKSKPLSVANPKTEGQVAQRTSFKSVASVGSVLLTSVVRPLYNPIAGDISGYNKFASLNKQMFSGDGTFQPTQSSIGGGTLIGEIVSSAEQNSTAQDLMVAWPDSAPTGSIRKTDVAVMWAIEPISGTIWSGVMDSNRSDQSGALPMVKGMSDLLGQLQCWVYVAFISADGRLCSVATPPKAFDITFSS